MNSTLQFPPQPATARAAGETLALDSMVGGLGDIWMRLSAIYTLAALAPASNIQLRIPKSLVRVAQQIWPDRFLITDQPLPEAIEITHLGIRHIARRMVAGQQFLSPFYQIQRADRKASSLKHRLNEVLIQAAKLGGDYLIPTAASVNTYQGYHECSAIRTFSEIPYDVFCAQAAEDFVATRIRLQALWPKSENPSWRVIVLPSGTGHQIMPPDWARVILPEATYVFFAGDQFKTEFASRGLQIVEFDDVASLLQIAAQATYAVVTDSFPSHPLQAYSAATIVALSQQPRSRIVHPAFDGQIIHSRAECCPCANRARGIGRCDAGLDYCTTWSHHLYQQDLLSLLA
jgi:hypothetical protein